MHLKNLLFQSVKSSVIGTCFSPFYVRVKNGLPQWLFTLFSPLSSAKRCFFFLLFTSINPFYIWTPQCLKYIEDLGHFWTAVKLKAGSTGMDLQWLSLKHRKTGLYFYSTRRQGLFRFIMALTTVHKYCILTEPQSNTSDTTVILSLFSRDPHSACFHWNCSVICCIIEGAMTLRLRTTGLQHSKNSQGKVVCVIKSKCSNSPTAFQSKFLKLWAPVLRRY